MVVSRSRTYAPGYGDLTIAGAQLEERRTFCFLEYPLSLSDFWDSFACICVEGSQKFWVVRRAKKLFDSPRDVKNCFNAYVLSNLEYRALVWLLSTESHLSLLNRLVRRAERLCEFAVWNTEGSSVPWVYSIRFITERTTLCMSICIILLQLVIVEF